MTPASSIQPIPREIDFELSGANRRMVVGSTLLPDGFPGINARGVALTVHGWTGHKDRNIVPIAADLMRGLGFISHRITLGHAGVKPNEDRITEADVFAADSLDNATRDVRNTLDMISKGEILGTGLPLVLVGHSRGGAQVIRIAATAEREGWANRPASAVCLAPVAYHGWLVGSEWERLERDGFVERPCARAEAGVVRMGPSWFGHRLDEPDRDHFSEDVRDVACPVLIIHATGDQAVGLDHARRIDSLAEEHGKTTWAFAHIEGGDHNFSAKGVADEDLVVDQTMLEQLRNLIAGFLP